MACRIKPVPVEAADEACQPSIDFYQTLFGYVPECMMVMAHLGARQFAFQCVETAQIEKMGLPCPW